MRPSDLSVLAGVPTQVAWGFGSLLQPGLWVGCCGRRGVLPRVRGSKNNPCSGCFIFAALKSSRLRSSSARGRDNHMGTKVKTILISQPKPSTERSPYFDLATKHKLKIDFRSFIHVEGVSGQTFRQERIDLGEHGSVIFTSRNAVDHYFRMAGDGRFWQSFLTCCLLKLTVLLGRSFKNAASNNSPPRALSIQE